MLAVINLMSNLVVPVSLRMFDASVGVFKYFYGHGGIFCPRRQRCPTRETLCQIRGGFSRLPNGKFADLTKSKFGFVQSAASSPRARDSTMAIF